MVLAREQRARLRILTIKFIIENSGTTCINIKLNGIILIKKSKASSNQRAQNTENSTTNKNNPRDQMRQGPGLVIFVSTFCKKGGKLEFGLMF